jgi:hypothetical protein
MRKNFIKLQAKTDTEKELLFNALEVITPEISKERSQEWRKARLENKPITNPELETLKNTESTYFEYEKFSSLILMGELTVETSFVHGYGNFIWKIPKNKFEKYPLRQLLREDPYPREKINELFEIEFICETEREPKSKINDEFLEKFPEIFEKSKFYIRVKDISFNVHKDSSLTFLELTWSLFNEVNRCNWILRKDYGDIPGKREREIFPFDLHKAHQLANKCLDACSNGEWKFDIHELAKEVDESYSYDHV